MPPLRMLLLGVLVSVLGAALNAFGQPANALALLAAEPNTEAVAAGGPRLKTLSARARRVLAQFDALITPAGDNREPPNGNEPNDDEPIDWDEALNLLEDLGAGDDHTVDRADEPGHYVPLREHCHAKIAALPPEGLQAYRDRVDPAARRLLNAGAEHNHTATLRRVVDEYFCSSWGDDALLLLGDLALERGDTITARRCWRRISPAASDPTGRPLAWALRDVDLEENGEQVKAIVAATTGVGLVHPHSGVPAGDLLARLAIASLYDGDGDAATTYAALLKLIAPGARGALTGRSGPLAMIVDQLVEEAESWPAEPAKRLGPLVGRVWPRPLPLTAAPAVRRPSPPRAVIIGGRIRFAQPAVDAPPTLSCRPTVAGDLLLYRDGPTLRAVDLLSGAPTLGPSGVLFAAGNASPAAVEQLDPFGRRRLLRTRTRQPQLPGDEPMTVVGGRLLARVVTRNPANNLTAPALRAFDLRREGLEAPVVEPVTEPWRIGGPATADAGRAYLPLVNNQTAPQLAVAAYSHATGRELWRTPVATGPASASFTAVTPPSVRIVRSGETLLLNTNLGAVAALDRRNGDLLWVRLYDRTPTEGGAAPPRGQGGSACVVARGRVFVTPTDSRHLFALDAATGRLLWATPLVNDNTPAAQANHHLLGVTGRTLVVGGDQLRGVDIEDGRLRYTWPESRKAGIRGAGRGCLVAGEVFWPTRDRILTFDAQRGSQSRLPLDIADLGGGANLVPAGGLLVAAGVKAMTVFGPVNREKKNNRPLLSRVD